MGIFGALKKFDEGVRGSIKKYSGGVQKAERSKLKGEIMTTYDKNQLVEYLGGHPEYPKKEIGELILTDKSIVFFGVNRKPKIGRYEDERTDFKLEIPLKDLKEVEYKPLKEVTGDINTALWNRQVFGTTWSSILGEKEGGILALGIDDAGMRVGIAFKFPAILVGLDKEGHEWQNQIISARHKVLKGGKK